MSLTRRAFLLAASSAVLMGLQTDEAEARRRDAPPARDRNPPVPAGPPRQFIFESLTGELVRAQFEDKPRHPASLTKMLTLYCVMETMKRHPEEFNLKTRIAIPQEINTPDFSRYGIFRSGLLRAGQNHPAEKLMAAAGTISCASSTTALAVHAGRFYREGENQQPLDAFVAHMNDCARRLGMTDSHFRNCVGTPDLKHYSTASDMAKLLKALYLDYPELSHLSMGHAQADLWPVAKRGRHTSGFLREHARDTMFAKTGTTNAAGRCLAAVVEIKGKPYVGVVIGGAASAECNRIMAAMVEAARRGERIEPRPNDAQATPGYTLVKTRKAPLSEDFSFLRPPQLERSFPKPDSPVFSPEPLGPASSFKLP